MALESSCIPVIAAIAVLIGHSKSCFLQFKGGKSVASGIGTIIALNWVAGIIIALIWAVITYVTKYVSVGSIIALILSPFIMYRLSSLSNNVKVKLPRTFSAA